MEKHAQIRGVLLLCGHRMDKEALKKMGCSHNLHPAKVSKTSDEALAQQDHRGTMKHQIK
jgi:hypothetical protein